MSLSSNTGAPRRPDPGAARPEPREAAAARTSRSPPMRKVSKGFGYRETEISLEEVQQLNSARRRAGG